MSQISRCEKCEHIDIGFRVIADSFQTFAAAGDLSVFPGMGNPHLTLVPPWRPVPPIK